LRENLNQTQIGKEFSNNPENDPKAITGRWSREEHERFIEGKNLLVII